jgi:hypothetical protein
MTVFGPPVDALKFNDVRAYLRQRGR